MAPPPPMPQPALPPMREVTEDTPPDMLAGNMDLRVLLPDGHAVKMNVDRSTPMMDLLVHVTTANKMSPGSHVIQAVGEKGNILPYKPSTPIGALDTWTIQVVSKSKTSGVGHKKAPLKPSNQPFEQTFRLQVNLPRNQLFVTRVSPRTPLVDVLRHVCSEKGLDPEKYDLRNPMNPDEVLCLTSNLFDYKLQEVTVALRGSTVPHNHHSRHRIHATSTADIISLQHHQQLADVGDKRRKSSGSTTTTNNSSGGVFGFIFKRGSRSSVCEGSVSSDSLGGHSISPARSDESLGPTRSVSPPLSHPVPRTVGASQDQLRNHINSQMSRRQDSTPRPISLSGDKKLKSPMEEGQPPPPPVRHRKRRAPKPPAQTSLTEGKITSEFITPAPPSEPAPIPVSRRKSGPIDDEEDEYEEEDIVVGDGRRGNHVGKGKGNHVGSASTGTTIISHSRNSSDSSGYHEASVLSESPESGVGGSGAPDTLPRRKQQQQMQRSSGCVNSQLPPFSRSMGNLAASNGPPSSVSTASSKTMMSSSSYSSLSASTSSLPGQKKKKAPAPPPPVVPAAAAPPKQSVVAEVHQRVDAPVKNSVPARENSVEGKSQVLNGKRAEEEVVNSHAVVEQPKSKPQSKNPVDQNSIPVISQAKPQLPHENHHDSSSPVKPAVCPVGPASKPAASVTKPGPAVAPKPQSKVNSSADLPRPMSYKSQDSEDVTPAPMPRAKPPMPKKRAAPRPAPRLKPAVVVSDDNEPKREEALPQQQKESESTANKTVNPSGLSALSIVPALDVSSEKLNDEDDVKQDDVDELEREGIDLEMFSGSRSHEGESKGIESKGVESEESEEEEFDEEVVQKALAASKVRTLANILDSKVDDSFIEDDVTGISRKSGDDEGFSIRGERLSDGSVECDLQSKNVSSQKSSAALSGSGKEVGGEQPSHLQDKHLVNPIRQVESAVNFSHVHKAFSGEVDDPNRFSSNSLCSEVDMPFVDGSGASKMNRWQNMESLVPSESASSLEKHASGTIVARGAAEEDDSVSASWVVGYESDTENVREAGDGSEVASNADTTDSMTVDSIDEVDCSRQQAIDSAFEETEKLLQPLDNNMIEKDRVYSHVEKMNGVDVTPTVLPSPPPSLEYMGPDVGKPSEAEGRVESVVETSDLDWEYKLPAPPSGFQDEDERRDGVEEVPAMMSGKKADERETWVAESETASIPSTFSSTASHRKIPTVEMDNLPAQHLPNFRMSTYKASSEDGGWEDPREEFNHRKVVDDCFGRSNGRTFVMLNSDGEAHSEKSFREPRKNSYETWASVSSKSSLSKGHYSNLDLSNPSPYGNTSLVMTSFKDPAQNGYEPNGVMNNGSYVVRVSSFGGKSAMALKRSLSSTSSLVSRHSSNDGREVAEKYERELAGNVVRSHVHMMNGMDNHLSNASRTVSLHDLAVNRIQEERKAEDHAKNGYHDENTTPKIVSSKWKKPQAVNGGPGTKFGPKKFNNIQNLRKTSSELSINQGYTNGWKDVKDEDSVASRQFSHWQDHIALETQMQEPLKSIQVLRGVLPHLKKSLSSDLIEHDQHEKVKEVAIHKVDTKEANGIEGVPEKDSVDESQLLRTKSHSLPRPSEHHQPSSDGMHQEEEEEETPKRYSYTGPPAINFGTWNERPKSEVSIKRDSDYRIGVGQAPRSRESFALPSPAHSQPSPPAIPHKSVVSNGNHHHNPPSASPPVENGPPCPPPKPAMNNRVTVNIVSASKPEPVSRLPIVRSVELKKTVSAVQLRNKPEHASQARPVSCKFPSDLREELSGALASLVDANRNSEMRQGAEEVNERRRRQQIPTESVPPPPPPPDTSASSGVNLRRAGSAVGSQDAGGPNVRVNGFMGHEKRQSGILFAPVVKGFRLNSVPPQSSLPAQAAAQPSQPSVAAVQPPPPPPPAVVCGVALKKKPVMPSGPKVLENPRDQLLVAIREFGGKDSLKKTALRYK